MGLVHEEECFKAIEALGNSKFALKAQINEMAKKTSTRGDMDKAAKALAEVHSIQMAIINDVSMRFKVVHPTIKDLTPEMEKQESYWDWYKRLYKKVHGTTPDTSELEAQNPQSRPKPHATEPLTPEELRERINKKVWVQPPNDPRFGRWATVEDVTQVNGETILHLVDDFTCHEYGRVWEAYDEE